MIASGVGSNSRIGAVSVCSSRMHVIVDGVDSFWCTSPVSAYLWRVVGEGDRGHTEVRPTMAVNHRSPISPAELGAKVLGSAVQPATSGTINTPDGPINWTRNGDGSVTAEA